MCNSSCYKLTLLTFRFRPLVHQFLRAYAYIPIYPEKRNTVCPRVLVAVSLYTHNIKIEKTYWTHSSSRTYNQLHTSQSKSFVSHETFKPCRCKSKML